MDNPFKIVPPKQWTISKFPFNSCCETVCSLLPRRCHQTLILWMLLLCVRLSPLMYSVSAFTSKQHSFGNKSCTSYHTNGLPGLVLSLLRIFCENQYFILSSFLRKDQYYQGENQSIISLFIFNLHWINKKSIHAHISTSCNLAKHMGN